MANIRESKCKKVIALSSKRKDNSISCISTYSMKKFMEVNTVAPLEMSSNFPTKNGVVGIKLGN